MKSHNKKIIYHNKIGIVKYPSPLFYNVTALIVEVCKDAELKKMDTKDLLTELIELL